MKSKMLIAILLGCLAWQQGVLSQTDTTTTTTTDTDQSTGTSTVNPPTAPAAGTTVSSSATSSVAALTVVFPPSITTQPANQTALNGDNATFSVTAAGTPPLSYQWYFNDSAISGATEANYTINGVTASNAGNHTVVVTSPYGSVTSSVTALTVVFTPSVAAQPTSQTVVNGNNTTFSVTAEGTPPLSYQWYFNGNAISGATEANYTINGVTTSNAGNYTVVVSNPYGSVTSSNATVGTSAATPPAEPAATAAETPSAATGTEPAAATAVTAPAEPAATATEAPSAATGTEPAAASAVTAPAEPVATATEAPSTAMSNETAAATAVTAPATPAATATTAPSTTTSNETASASSSTPQVSAPASIPLIQFQDVPITTAIENLARQAGINYLLDPKIGYGQPDQNGQIKPEPTLSIRWENITAQQALLALLDNYGLQVTEDRRTHISRITTKDPTAPPSLATRVIQLKYASTSNMVTAVQAALTDKRSKVLADLRTSQLIVVATDAEQEAVDTLINQLDKPTRQVLIETKLVELASNPSTVKGIDWTRTLAQQNISFGNGSMSGDTTAQIPGTPVETPAFGGHPATTTTPKYSQQTFLDILQGSGGLSWNTLSGFTPAMGFLNADGLQAVLSFLNSSAIAQVVNTPRVVTLDNETAIIAVTRGYPVINVAYSTVNVAGGTSITYSNIGTTLHVTPRISANDYIWLKVVPDVSSFFDSHKQTIGGLTYTADIFDSRHIETQVLIPNANTLVLGGLVKDSPTAHYTKVPVLGDIPGLGWAFRSESKSVDKSDLLIFITPTIVKESDFRPTSTDFLKSQSTTLKSPINPNSMWDSALPHGDWSNPAPTPGESDQPR